MNVRITSFLLLLSGVNPVFGVSVRLVGGKSNLEGRVEVFYNNTWGTVCDDHFGNLDAQVFCFMLGYRRNGARALEAAFYGPGNGTIWLDGLDCNGTEISVADCSKNRNLWGSHDCDHSEDAGIICQPRVRLVGGNTQYEGRIEVKYSNAWGTVCDSGFGILDAQVFCHMLGHERLGAAAFGNAHFGQGTGHVWLKNLTCFGNETSVSNCSNTVWGSNECKHEDDAGIRCIPNQDIRLSGGVTEYEGRIEIFHSASWGTLCDRYIGASEAQVLCNMLGYPSVGAIAYGNAYFGQGSGSVWLNYLDCNGQESSILACRNSSFISSGCDHSEDVGVRCKPRVRLVGGSSVYEGRVEVYHSGEWGTVCDDGFDTNAAQVFCYMLGYERNGTVAKYGGGTGKIWLDDLLCTGTERSVDECSKAEDTWGINNCGHNEDVGIKCQPKIGCSGLKAVENGKYSLNSCTTPISPVGLTCSLTCEAGFEYPTYRSTACLGAGIWNISDLFLSCADIDECENKPCEQTCRNTPGTFECSCNGGFYLKNDNKTCTDIIECDIDNGGCGHNCTNEIGSFRCDCADGYSLQNDNLSCEDTDECDADNGNCEHLCINEEGSYFCVCNNGFNLENDTRTCTDIDECSRDNGGCDQICNNMEGAFSCSCNFGYLKVNDTGSCEDVNECDTDNGGCHHMCQNENGTFFCYCWPGYFLQSDNVTCEDVNECGVSNGGCDHNCTNENGSFSCECLSGYNLQNDNKSCVDVDECEFNNGGCDHICTNENGAYSCSCEEGYSMDTATFLCTDINECLVSNGGCSHTCINFVGNFSCTCEKGYSLKNDRLTCSDENECETNNGGCEHICHNEIGSYSCECEKGYFSNNGNVSCEDIIECDKDNGGCMQTCINLDGSFICSCARGYIVKEDGLACINVSHHSISSSLRVLTDTFKIGRLQNHSVYHAISQHLRISLGAFFSKFTSEPFSVAVQRLSKYSSLVDGKAGILVNYTIVYGKETTASVRDALIRGTFGFSTWKPLVYNGERVMAKLVNEPPTISPLRLVVNVSEDTTEKTVVAAFTVNDPDNDVRGHISVYSDDKPDGLKIGPIKNSKVQLFIEHSLDADKYKSIVKQGIVGPVINFTITVKDEPGLKAKANVSLTIIDINDHAPKCNPARVTVKIPRDTEVGEDVYSLDTVCKDGDFYYNSIVYTMQDDSCTSFRIDKPASLKLKSEILDKFPSCLVTVNVADMDNTLFSSILKVRVKFDECPSDKDYLNTTWKRGTPGRNTLGLCPEGYAGEVKRFCGYDAVYHDPVYNCTRSEIAKIFEKVLQANASTSDVLDELANVTGAASVKNNSLLIGDLDVVSEVMNKITEVIEVKPENVKRITNSFTEIANNILDKSTTKSWTSKMDQTGTGADTVLGNLDRFTEKIATASAVKSELKVAKSNLFLKVGSTDACEGRGIQFPNRKSGGVPEWAEKTSDSVQAPCGDNTTSYSSVMYRDISHIIPSKVANKSAADLKLNAPVLSFSLLPKSDRKLDEPVEIKFQLFNSSLDRPICSFWNSSTGTWSTTGCWLDRISKDKKYVVCKCSHLTNFAVLMSPSSAVSPNHHAALSTISMVGCILSMLCLVLTVGIHGYFWRAVKSEKSILNMNLSCALFVAYLLFLAGVNQTENKGACTAIAVLLHIVYLAVFFIMLSEGLLLANTVLYPFSTRKPGIPLLIGSYVMAVIIVAISMGAVQLDGYGDEQSCWLSTSSGLIWAFLAPVLLVIVMNLTIVTLVIRKMFGTAVIAKKTDKEKAKTGVRSIIILMPIMGITWVFGIFSVNEDTVAFQYIFALFNCIQGVLIFVFHCVMNKKIQMAFRKQRSKWQSLRSYDVSSSFSQSTKTSRLGEESTSVM